MNIKQFLTKHITHVETLTQTVSGLLISFIILHLWGMSFSESVALQTIFLVVSYIRSFCVRSVFKKYF